MNKRLLLLPVLVCFTIISAFSQSAGDYRSAGTGNWNETSTWEVFDGVGWAPASSTPTSADGIITLMDGHVVTIPNGFSVTVDQIEFENNFGGSTGNLSIASGGTMIVNNGTGDDIRLLNDFTTFALVEVYGTLQLSTGATIVDDDYGNLGIGAGPVTPDTYKVRDGGVHIHTTGTGVDAVPYADWQTGSTCQINATSGTVPSISSSITFHHFTWNGSSQTTLLGLASSLQNINGDFTVTSTNGQVLQLGTTTSYTLTIGGSFFVQGNSRVQLATSASPVTLNITGNFNILSSSTFTNTVSFNATGTDTKVNITGDFLKFNGSSVSLVAGTTGTTALNVQGNFTLSGGTITRNASVSSGSASINFTGTATSSFSNSATISNAINFTVSSGRTIDLGTSALTGSGTFTNNGTIRVGSTDASGAIQTGTAGGNIRVSGGRTYASGSTVIYNGAAAQFMGDGHPASANTIINNASGVTLAANATITGALTLTSGNLSIGSNTLTMESTFTPNANFLNVTSSSSLVINGTGALGSLAITGSTTINNLTINRTSSGSVTLGTDLAIGGTLTQTNGDIVLNGNTLTLNGAFARTSGNVTINSASSFIVEGAGELPSAISFSGSQLNTLTLNRASSTLSTAASITLTNLNLTSGIFDNTGTITMASGGTITRTALGSMSTAPAAATSYNVVYDIGNDISSGVELPTGTTQLNDLTKQGSSILTLSAGATINGTLTLTSGTFNAGTNAVDIKGNFVSNAPSQFTSSAVTFSGTTVLSGSTAPVFGAVTISGTVTPSVNYQINGNLANNGTLNAGTGTVTFGGTTTVSGSSTSSFNNVVVGNTLTAPTGSMNVAGSFTNNGTFNNNGGTVVFNGTTSISGTSTTNFASITISNTLNSPATLNVAGNFTNNGTFNRGTGTVVFNGTSTQYIQGGSLTEFNHISITNTASPLSVQVLSNQDLRGTLTLAANSIFDPDGTSGAIVFRLRSTDDSPTADASIATLPSGAQIQGNVTVQRYMAIESGVNGNNRFYRNISSPVQNAPASQIKAFIPISGTFTGANHTGRQSMFEYNEVVTADANGSGTADLNDGYLDFPADADTETLQTAKGYNIFIRGDETPITTAGSALWEVRGPINAAQSSPIAFPVSYTSSGTLANDGWNLVGNPFPSTIDWNAANGWVKGSDLNATIYIPDNGGSPARFATWNGATGTNGGSRYIATGQAFWVKADGSNETLTADERVKAAGTQTTFFRTSAPDNLLRITLRNGNMYDEAVIHFRDDASDGYDSHADALKLENSTVNLSTLTSDHFNMAINSLAEVGCGRTVPLDVSDVAEGGYSLDFSEFESFPEYVNITLHDAVENKLIDVRAETSYFFNVTSDEHSFGSQRFLITFSPDEPETVQLASPGSFCADESAVITIENADSDALYSILNNNDEVVVNPVPGNGGSMTLTVPKEHLLTGHNQFTLTYARQTCEQLTSQVMIPLDILSKPVVEAKNASRCGAGEISLIATGAEEGNYRWYETETGDDLISGNTSSIYSPALTKTKTYYVSGMNAAGCEGTRVPVIAEIIHVEEAVISVEGQVLQSNYPTGNQWYFNGDPIAGATGPMLEATHSGFYELVVSIGACHLTTSREFVVLGPEPINTSTAQLYPNPVEHDFTISMKCAAPSVELNLYNSFGVKVLQHTLVPADGAVHAQISLASYPRGVYFIYLLDGNTLYTEKIIRK